MDSAGNDDAEELMRLSIQSTVDRFVGLAVMELTLIKNDFNKAAAKAENKEAL
jgi:hypothetical protein